MPNGPTHCKDHLEGIVKMTEMATRLDILEHSIDDKLRRLFELSDGAAKHRESVIKQLSDIQACVTATGERIGKLEEAFVKRNEYADTVVKWGEEQVANLQEQIDQLNDFSWFRETVNRWKAELPWWVFRVVVMFLVLLAIWHWTDLGMTIRGIFKR